jgi:hypothetical protein
LVALGRFKQIGSEPELGVGHIVALAGDFEPFAKQLRPRPLTSHPAKEFGIIVAAIAN